MNEALLNSYRWHRSQFYRWKSEWRGAMPAKTALDYARGDVANGKARYPSDICPAVTWQSETAPHDAIGTWSNPFPRKRERFAHVDSPEKAGLRLVGRVMPECRGRNGIWDTRDSSGWCTDPHGDVFKDGTGLCYGVVYQLPGRNGKARFVAGYQFGGTDAGPTLDFGNIIEDDARSYGYSFSAFETDGARDAAYAADSMAEQAATEEREYQTAFSAGSYYADTKAEMLETRRQLRELLADRRRARAIDPGNFPSICEAIRSNVMRALDDLKEAREKMRQLAAGDYSSRHICYGFYTGDKALRAAFNDGAGEIVIT